MQDTIFALATGSQACAVAIIRISGPRATEIGTAFCKRDLRAREASYARIIDPKTGELIDTGLVLFFVGPASFTGEDCVEFQVHGSRAVVLRLLDALGREPGARIAQPGEFIRRAFDNGKLALTSVEGVADLIAAKTDLQRRQALAQAGGALALRGGIWRDMLLDALALITAEIDFADEGEAPAEVLGVVRKIVENLSSEFSLALADAERGELIRNGFRVVLCGPPNAGKSTLMNTIARRDVAIVTEHAGTTRDVIEVELDLGGLPVIICDTAGIREAVDPVEAIGVQRSIDAIGSADLSIWVSAAVDGVGRPELGSGRSILVASKMDQVQDVPAWADLGISARSGDGIDELIRRISAFGSEFLAGEPPIVTNARQRACVEAAARQVARLMADDFSALELVADDLLRCADILQELLGRIGAEDILGAVFSRFCMGK